MRLGSCYPSRSDGRSRGPRARAAYAGCPKPVVALVGAMAERVRFELTSPVKGLRFSRPVQSTALPPLQFLLHRRVARHFARFARPPQPTEFAFSTTLRTGQMRAWSVDVIMAACIRDPRGTGQRRPYRKTTAPARVFRSTQFSSGFGRDQIDPAHVRAQHFGNYDGALLGLVIFQHRHQRPAHRYA